LLSFQNDIFIKILAENQTILKLPLSQKHPNIKESSVFISGDSLPDKPHIPVECSCMPYEYKVPP
jgi:hypothetical protein